MEELSMKMILKLVLFAFMGLATSLPAATPGQPAQTNAPADSKAPVKLDELLPDTVLVKARGFQIKRSQLDEAMTDVKKYFVSQGRAIPPEELDKVEKQTLDHLIMLRLLTGQATDAQKAKGREESEKYIKSRKENFPSEEAFNLRLKSQGLTQDTLMAQLIEQAVAEQVMKSKVSVTDDQVKKFYDENPAKFEEPETVRATHIFLFTVNPKTGVELPQTEKDAKKKQIDDLQKRALGGEDFAKLAADFSEDPGLKDNKGEVIFAHDAPGIPQESIAAAFTLKTNQVSDVITTQIGYDLIKLKEKVPPHKVELAKASESIKNYLEKLEIEKIIPDYFEKSKKEAGVEILDEKFKAMDKAAAAAATAQPDPAKKDPGK